MAHLQKFIRNFAPCTLLIHVPFYWNVILSIYSGESNSGKSICANQTHKRLIYKLAKLLFNLPWECYLIQEPEKFTCCFSLWYLSVKVPQWIQKWKHLVPILNEFIFWRVGWDNTIQNTIWTTINAWAICSR